MPGEHYYTANPQSAHRPGEVRVSYRGEELSFSTDSGVFSRTELDEGTEILLNALPEEMSGTLLDMGCGWGVIGVALGKKYPALKITMADINERACGLAAANAAANGVTASVFPGDGYAAVAGARFDWIVQNPPIRAGKQVIYGMFRDAAAALNEGGSCWLVIRKQQGAPSAKTYLETLFEDVQTPEKKRGFWIFACKSPRKEILSDEV